MAAPVPSSDASAGRDAVIAVTDLSVEAGRRHILSIERLAVARGDLVSVMGPNGSGKTTLLRVCLGLQPATAGQVRVFGRRLKPSDGAGLAGLRRRIGYVPQLLPVRSELPMTVREVVAIGRTARAGLFHALSRDDWDAVDHWMARLGLAPLANRAFGEISGGEQRKAIIARAMAQEPELLLLDEPAANLDLGWRERMVETVETLYAETRVSVVLVCHELEVLPPSCRHVVLLDAGRVAATGSPEAVFTTDRIRRLFGASLRAVHEGGRHAVVPQGGGHD
ncbi:MAG: metal ABC transporter ATP-binding protein [Verrucomicrobia bacterium]|nr:metal ABC transporter ATP-binding protein [Verrucomicrobiota bacterium]